MEMAASDTLGDRMKRYESESPSHDGDTSRFTVIRLDGCHFKTWTRRMGMESPFDERVSDAMRTTTLKLCERIPSCGLGYTQSDEIALVLRRGVSGGHFEPWFSNRIQKMCSVAASMASAHFNRRIGELFAGASEEPHLAFFDARVILMPNLMECMNFLVWRQNDCLNGSVSGYARTMFSKRELSGKRFDDQKAMMLDARGFRWDSLEPVKRLGVLVHRGLADERPDDHSRRRTRFFIDMDTPRFSDDMDFLYDAYRFDGNDGEK